LNSNTRGCVAYIAAGLSGLTKVTSFYDHTENKPMNVSGTVTAEKIDAYDFDRSCHVSGSLDNLFDFGNQAHVQIIPNGEKFSGYDYASKFHFTGSVEKGVVSIYDY
jgi:hypothetical protein